ncbi:MAG: hypothetical protein LBT23_09000 [Synergistaceae bacterium]|jgi:hypothetical protein|nr:hypothetical protein [Synergistaceae bacterium]
MSKFVDFYNKINLNDALRTEFTRVMKERGVPEGTSFEDLDEGTLAALEPVANRAGISFKLSEALAYFSKKEGGELSDFELEAVAGGAKCVPDKVEYTWVDSTGSYTGGKTS